MVNAPKPNGLHWFWCLEWASLTLCLADVSSSCRSQLKCHLFRDSVWDHRVQMPLPTSCSSAVPLFMSFTAFIFLVPCLLHVCALHECKTTPASFIFVPSGPGRGICPERALNNISDEKKNEWGITELKRFFQGGKVGKTGNVEINTVLKFWLIIIIFYFCGRVSVDGQNKWRMCMVTHGSYSCGGHSVMNRLVEWLCLYLKLM